MTIKGPYKRILLKISGELLMGSSAYGIDKTASKRLAQAIASIFSLDIELAIVIGGGNIYRGINSKSLGIERSPADHIGMLATLMNGITLQNFLVAEGLQATVMSALDCPKVAEPYNWQKANDLLKNKQCVIFVGGTGNPYFSTDSAAALRACEMNADLLMKATKVDGIYNKDPIHNTDAIKYQEMSYAQVLAEKLQVMDATAIALCQSNAIPILVFNMKLLFENQEMIKLFSQKDDANFNGTLVHGN